MGSRRLMVKGRSYSHSAAKFWTSLFDEVAGEFPGCSCIELEAPISGAYDRGFLHPLEPLEAELKRLALVDDAENFAEVVSEMEIMGPPASVALRLLKGGEELFSRELPADMIDAEILPYLVAWLLEWAEVPESLWNQAEVKGSFEGEDRLRARKYVVSFELRRKHLSEGLFMQTLAVTPDLRVIV